MDINSIINAPTPSMDASTISLENSTSLSTPLFQSIAKTPTRRSSTKEGKQKLFQCTGFGDCKMVFTRSEHLARHARKHTGEKPFQCVVPSCNRMFSRFDNMMQHTQTHNHRRDHSKQPIILNTDRRQVRKSSVSSCSSVSSPVSETSPQLPSPQLPKLYPIQIPSSPPNHQDRFLPPPLTIPIPSQSWNSPMPVSPVSPVSSYSPGSYSPIPSLAPLSMSDPTPSSSHTRGASQPNLEPIPMRVSGHGPRTASDPMSYVYSQNNSWSDHSPPSSSQRMGRRLSIFDLCNPIETLIQPGPALTARGKETDIMLTEDEIEALQGIGKFHCYPVKKEETG